MRTLVLFLVCFLSFTMDAQIFGNVSAKPDIYVYNKAKDTIYLTKMNLGRWSYCGNVKVVDSIQIDGKGAKELVFYREGSYVISEHGGSFDINASGSVNKYEIWNTDTKTILFEAVRAYSSAEKGFRAGWPPIDRKENYKYDFAINSTGTIFIDNFCGSLGSRPDRTVGTYQFIDGKYTKL